MILPSRYTTEVTVEMIHKNTINYFHFADIQVAYIWIKRMCNPTMSFIDACNNLDDAYIRKGKGTRVRVFEDITNTFHIYYWKFNSATEIHNYRNRFQISQ